MIVSILTDRYVKLAGFPINSSLDFADRRVFVKTGTSRNFRDNWAVGFTDRYMIGVWTGNKSGENMKGVSGATGAGQIFSRIVSALSVPEQALSPKAIVKQEESYLAVTSPLSGSVYRMESSKPKDTQKIRLAFRTNESFDTAEWMLDGKRIDTEFIDPVPGNHTVEVVLLNDGGVVGREKNTFRVEGAEK